MIQHGESPYLECSTRGDKRFSAFCARPSSLCGKSIEDAYQAMKVFEDGSTRLHWKLAKGRKAVNQDACQLAYITWWREWIAEYELMPILIAATGLSDVFGQIGSVCQATILWNLRNEAINK